MPVKASTSPVAGFSEQRRVRTRVRGYRGFLGTRGYEIYRQRFWR
jgi:hypothetical protein